MVPPGGSHRVPRGSRPIFRAPEGQNPCLYPWCITRLHPQGKGGPQAILCGRRLKSSQKSENVPTKQIQKSIIFERSVVYCSWTFCSKKCVFDTSCGTLNKGKLKKWTVPKFQLVADALTMPPKKCVPGPCRQWQKWSKIRACVRAYGGPYFRQRFLSVAHTKCPSGNDDENGEHFPQKVCRQCPSEEFFSLPNEHFSGTLEKG